MRPLALATFAVALAAALCVGAAAVLPSAAGAPEAVPRASAAETAAQMREIYCPTRDCTGGRDWLVMKPSAAAGWAVGSVAFLASGILVQFRNSFTCLAMTELGISLFLRAGLNYKNGNKRSIYIASLFFNYHAAVLLFVGIVGGAFMVKLLYDQDKPGRSIASTVGTVLVNMALFSMVVAGVVIMFREETLVTKNVGWRLIQAVFYIMVILTAVSFGLLVWNIFTGDSTLTVASVALLVAAILIGLWSSFMLARTYLPLGNVTHSSEVAFYLLNVAPLLIIGIIF
ncbi:hypothetical protein H4R18_002478 [Coemansia javaensis]|uniref:Chitin synthase export chaperone n=1 Tax=Coemansia javaensis TaxID=2761396 RepID=A0A9W8HCW0_9FUNG|nr:hypothetical protein H4R18_002478 [Coemansia javaensis]